MHSIIDVCFDADVYILAAPFNEYRLQLFYENHIVWIYPYHIICIFYVNSPLKELKWKENVGQSSKFQLQMPIKSRNVFKIDNYSQKITFFLTSNT